MSTGIDIRYAHCRWLVLPVWWLLVICVCFPSISYASSPPNNAVRICGILDYEQWEHDYPRPAAKRPADLNIGDPRTVRMIYFLPNDWPYRAEVVDSMKTIIRQAQTFYADQMEAHGYGRKTFRFETNARGEPLVHRVDGQYPFSHYDNTLGTAVVAELEQTFDLDANIYVIVLGTDALRQGDGQPAGGVGWQHTKNGGALVVPDDFSFFTVAHELGHTFGLEHDFRDDRYIMSYGWYQRSQLSACAAEFLSGHTYFNPAIPIEEGQPPTVELISSNRYSPGSTSVPVRLNVSSSVGLHQVSLIGGRDWCRGFKGEKDAVVEFNYEGFWGQYGFSALSENPKHYILIVAVDTDGNVSETYFSLTATSSYEIAILKGPKDIISSVAFSPDGGLLAFAAQSEFPKVDAAIMLLDIETRESISILNTEKAGAVAFSPDGVLASDVSGGIKLWDVSSRKEIATLPYGWGNVSFSHDGSLLASGAAYHTIKLWDVSSRKEIASLKGHTDQINALAFSPDGTLLASGSGNIRMYSKDNTVRLWDISSGKEIATLEVPGAGVWSVAFSPDEKTLAWGASGGGTTLWDVASEKEIITLEDGGPPVAFSPDGTILFYNSYGKITLWDVASQKEIVTLTGEANNVYSMSISPDGTLLASGSWLDGTITLWDVSEWMRSRPSDPDFDGDGTVGIPDFLLFVDQFGLSQRDAGYEARFDLDGDGVIGISDFLIFVNSFGTSG